MAKLRCSNDECESNAEGGQQLFSINCTVDIDRDLAENLKKIQPQYFECCFCCSFAVDVEDVPAENSRCVDQPYWAGKDVVGYLLQMGWTVHMDGMRKGSKLIPEASIIGADASSPQKEVALRLAKWTTHREEQS